MVEEPSPPPVDEQTEGDTEEEQEERREDPGLYPYIEAAAAGTAEVTVRAGWAEQESGEPTGAPVVNFTGAMTNPAALAAYEAALEWYRGVVTNLYRRAQAEEEGRAETE